MQWIINLGIGFLIIPSLLVVIIPIIDSFFNFGFISYVDQIMSGLSVLIGSNNVNYVFQILAIIMFYFSVRFILKFISSFK